MQVNTTLFLVKIDQAVCVCVWGGGELLLGDGVGGVQQEFMQVNITLCLVKIDQAVCVWRGGELLSGDGVG